MQKLPQFLLLTRRVAWRCVALRPLHFTLIVCRGHGGSQPVSPMQPTQSWPPLCFCFSLNSRRRRLRWSTRGVTDRCCSGSRDSVGHGQGRGDPTARALTSADPHPGTRGASSPRSTSWDGLVELELKRRAVDDAYSICSFAMFRVRRGPCRLEGFFVWGKLGAGGREEGTNGDSNCERRAGGRPGTETRREGFGVWTSYAKPSG